MPRLSTSKLPLTLVPLTLIVLITVVGPLSVHADGPGDNIPANVRPIPPVGIDVPPEEQQHLQQLLKELQQQISELRKSSLPVVQRYLPDVEIYHRAVAQAVEYQEFYAPRDIANARKQLEEGLKRAAALARQQTPWTEQTGFVVRGYRSRIDDTVQPYGLEIPAHYRASGNDRWRLDLWLHGRGEKVTESVFIAQRQSQTIKYTPIDTIILHPFGRYCNAFKFAGEIDVLEALEHARADYRVDDDRVSVRGFSMGGAGCWQLAVHYPDLFFAANPGAGFAETEEFLNFFQNEAVKPTWYERVLWQMYDCPHYAANFRQLPLIAYSGEIDKQKQAADIMEKALRAEGLNMTHVIGPQTAHAVHADSARIIEEKMTQLARRGRNTIPERICFATPTLKYNRMHWLTVTGLREHWQPARVEAALIPGENRIEVQVRNVTGLEFNFPAGHAPFQADRPVVVTVAELGVPGEPRRLEADRQQTDGSWQGAIFLDGDTWRPDSRPVAAGVLAKRHNLQGPIDDAFMDRFLIVKPSGNGWHETTVKWSQGELDRLVREWRRQFRGDARVIEDHQLTEELAADNHLILFGDPESNSVIRNIMGKLPLQWTRDAIQMRGVSYPADQHAPVLIYPNPAHPERYIVLNSGFTYREYAYLNNARQVPTLPDWAVIDLTTPPNSLWPGKIADAGFFDEQWLVKPQEH
ncbi:MAG: prolyl oligopeptidase family serine peptidase [Planctomycetaceae bacterium]|nr:prolyl oligopeptidase family serine peptidase [Planctomycetaceae bacterium]